MDRNREESWFEFEFNPYSAVADYANQPPRGMTNPPMNLKLRKQMVKDFNEFGLQLEEADWPVNFVHTAKSAPTSPSNPDPSRLARTGQSRAKLMYNYADNLRQGRVLQKGSIFSRTAPSITGAREEESAVGHPDWHQYHPFPHILKPIDRKGPVSLVKTPSHDPKAEKRTVRFAEDEKKSLADHLAKQASPVHTEFIKTPSNAKATTRGQRMTLDASGTRPSSEAPGMAKKSKDSGKDAAKDEDGKKKDGVIDTTELDNRMRSLRGMSQLHRAAVADRFRFGASAAAGEPMVLNASTLNQANPGSWASDSAFLNKFHNSAVRIVAPSGLEVLKEPASKKKKKKKQKQDDDTELKMSDSGLFVARYPIDDALIKIRKIRKKAFPEEEPPPPGPSPEEEHRKEAARDLMFSLGGCLLSRIRGNEDDEKEMEQALLASGYAGFDTMH